MDLADTYYSLMKNLIFYSFLLISLACNHLNPEEKERDIYVKAHTNIYQELVKLNLKDFKVTEDSTKELNKFAVVREGMIVDKDLFILLDKKFTTLNSDSLKSLVVVTSRDIIVGKYDSGVDAITVETIIDFYDLIDKVKFASMNVIGKMPPKKVYGRSAINYVKGEERTNGILFCIQSKLKNY